VNTCTLGEFTPFCFSTKSFLSKTFEFKVIIPSVIRELNKFKYYSLLAYIGNFGNCHLFDVGTQQVFQTYLHVSAGSLYLTRLSCTVSKGFCSSLDVAF